MEIIDNVKAVKKLRRDDLKQGSVYQTEHGDIVMMTDEQSVLQLDSGYLYILYDHFNNDSVFIERTAKLILD